MHLLTRNRLLQNDLTALEITTGHGLHQAGNRVVTDVVFAVLKDQAAGLRAAFGAAAQRFLRAEVGELTRLFARLVVAEIEFELVVLGLVVKLENDLGGERPTGLGAKSLERADFLVA